MPNLDLAYRPLRIGVSIVNGRIKEPGTIGLFGRDDAGSQWLVSCYHVLCDGGLGSYSQDDVIYQPAAAVADFAVAKTSVARSSIDLDCAAALLTNGIDAVPWIPGLGAIGQLSAPQLNARVLKVGAAGGLTEGIVTQITGSTVVIRTDPTFPTDYVISQAGDSGALWLNESTRAPVALHRGIRGPRTATATAIGDVLQILKLKQA